MITISCNGNLKRLCENEYCKFCYEKSFASSPKATCWSDKNDKNPREVFKSSGNKYKFICNICGHLFESIPAAITNGKWCPYCVNQKLCENEHCKCCYEKSFASHPKSICWSDTNDKNPREVFKSSNKKYEFICDICNHVFESSVADITRGHWCSYCVNLKLCENEYCKCCYEKSFASSPKANCWSDTNDKKPREVFKSSHKKYEFICDICDHVFESSLANATIGHWCPYCVNLKLCENEHCKCCYEKSFASHPKSIYWSDKNDKTQREVFKSSDKKYEFECNKCKHLFESRLSNITINKRWCPYCSSPPRKLCENIQCKSCYEKSFASSTKANYWSDKNDKNPRKVFKSSYQKYKFICDICNYLFESSLNHITTGTWCPRCINKTELKLYNWLLINYPETSREKTFDWCKNPMTNRHFRFDFFIPEKNILIELDGGQHFKQVSNWGCFKRTQQTDVYKMKKANENGFTIIRVLQEDIFNDNYDWKNQLIDKIDKIYEIPTNIYICKKNEYDSHQEIYNILNISNISNIELEDEEENDNEN